MLLRSLITPSKLEYKFKLEQEHNSAEVVTLLPNQLLLIVTPRPKIETTILTLRDYADNIVARTELPGRYVVTQILSDFWFLVVEKYQSNKSLMIDANNLQIKKPINVELDTATIFETNTALTVKKVSKDTEKLQFAIFGHDLVADQFDQPASDSFSLDEMTNAFTSSRFTISMMALPEKKIAVLVREFNHYFFQIFFFDKIDSNKVEFALTGSIIPKHSYVLDSSTVGAMTSFPNGDCLTYLPSGSQCRVWKNCQGIKQWDLNRLRTNNEQFSRKSWIENIIAIDEKFLLIQTLSQSLFLYNIESQKVLTVELEGLIPLRVRLSKNNEVLIVGTKDYKTSTILLIDIDKLYLSNSKHFQEERAMDVEIVKTKPEIYQAVIVQIEAEKTRLLSGKKTESVLEIDKLDNALIDTKIAALQSLEDYLKLNYLEDQSARYVASVISEWLVIKPTPKGVNNHDLLRAQRAHGVRSIPNLFSSSTKSSYFIDLLLEQYSEKATPGLKIQ